MAVKDRLISLAQQGRRGLGPGADRARALWRRAVPFVRVVSAHGWSIFVLSVFTWTLGWLFGWVEMMYLAAGCLALFVIAALMTLGRTKVSVVVTAKPQRVTVGDPAAGDVRVENLARTPLLPIGLELPIGAEAARFQLPLLAPGTAHEELFVVPTGRRGVVAVGPARTVRGDPFGLMRRTVDWSEVIEIFVHPLTVALEPLGSGLLRDLEGNSTNDISMSDLDFHALRDYQPGDDRRYIHWRSSAKAGPGRFLVRQFLDTRRSHVCVMVDSDPASYNDPDEYEIAISCAASIAIRCIKDEQEVTVLAGDHLADATVGNRILDTFSRAELSGRTAQDLARRAVRQSLDMSTALIVTGPNSDYTSLRRAASQFPIEINTLVLRVDPNSATTISGGLNLPVLSLSRLTELGALLAGALA